MRFSRLSIALLTTFLATTTYAKSVNLYDQPQPNAKVVGTIASDSPMVPIFSSKDGKWMKVGDPKDGTVGWVKVGDLSNNNNSGFSFTQQTINSGDGPKTTIQFGVPQEMSEEQIKDIQKKQAEVQKSIQKMMTDMYSDINKVYGNSAVFPAGAYPVFMPIVVVPAQQPPQPRTTPTPKAIPTTAPSTK
jgi:hypothetical protein